MMEIKLGPLRQIAFSSSDLARAIAFYQNTLGLDLIAQFDPPGIAFLRMGQTRLMLQRSPEAKPSGTVLYFEVPDIQSACAALKVSGIDFDAEPQMIFRDEKGTFGDA